MSIVTRNAPPFDERGAATVYIGEAVNAGFRLQQPDGSGGWTLQSYTGRVFGLRVYSDGGNTLVNVLGALTSHADGAYIACSIPGTTTAALAVGVYGWEFCEFITGGRLVFCGGTFRVAAASAANQASGDPGASTAGSTVYTLRTDQGITTVNFSGGAGPGVPTGGTAGQYLRKASSADFDTGWDTITSSDVSGLDTQLAAKEATANKGVAGGYASLDGSGLVPAAQLPSLAITDTFAVASQAAMLALSAQKGDVAIRSDLSKSYVLSTNSPSTLGDWLELLTPPDAVLSVAGKTGTVTLVKGDVGLGNVDNTADTAKPVSTAQQAALDAKASLTGAVMSGVLAFVAGTVSAPGLAVAGDLTTGVYAPAASTIALTVGGTEIARGVAGLMTVAGSVTATGTNLTVANDSAALVMGASSDVKLVREAAGALAQRNGANIQSFRVYGTYTDNSNYERLALKYSSGSGAFQVFAEAAGTGVATRQAHFGTLGTGSVGILQNIGITWYWFGGAGHLYCGANNSYDIGDNGNTVRPRSIYAGTKVVAPILSGVGGTLAASAPSLDISQTWNNGAVAFTGALVNVTNTASSTSSKILDVQLAGVSKVYVDYQGQFYVGTGTTITTNAVYTGSLSPGNNSITYDGSLGAGIIAQRAGTTAQTFRLYNTYTDASNYERAFLRWSANFLQIGTESAGTGTNRSMYFSTGGADRWTITSGGNWQAVNDNALDIGSSGTGRARTGYFATSVVAPILNGASGTITASAPALDLSQTWNGAGVVFTAIRSNVTPTAYATNSYLLDLQVGGLSKLYVKYNTASGGADLACNSISVGDRVWATGFIVGGATPILQDATNFIALRNGVSAQTVRLYNTYTDASNYERYSQTWSSNVLYLKNENAGTGSARLMVPVTGATTVASLPAAATAGAGARSMVTDATATTFASTVAGGGSNKVPVVSDGTNWLIG